MCSVSKPSIMITEDGRAAALRQVTGGLILDGYARFKKKSLPQKAMTTLHLLDIFEAQPNIGKDLVNNLQHELTNGMPRLSVTRKSIDHLYSTLKRMKSKNYKKCYREKSAFKWVPKWQLLNAIDKNYTIGGKKLLGIFRRNLKNHRGTIASL